MIYLIGGSPRSGKTIFSQKLAQKLDCPIISLDDIRTEEIRKLGEKASEKFPLEEHSIKNIDVLFQNNSSEKILSLEIADAHALWPKTESIIQNSIKSNANTIIEGVQLLPELIEKYKDNKKIKILFFYKKDKAFILSGFYKNNNSNDWLLGSTKNPATLERAAQTYALCGEYFIQEAKKYYLESINMENDFENKLQKLINEQLN